MSSFLQRDRTLLLGQRPGGTPASGPSAADGQELRDKFVRLGEYAGSAFFGVHDKARSAYEEVVHEHARDGWRLVQIFAPGVAAFGAAKYYELIFEREHAEGATTPKGASRELVGSAEHT